jgi:hypothetical protein
MTRPTSLAGSLASSFERRSLEIRAASFPMARYAKDIVAYVRERLHVAVILPHQKEILLAVQAAVDGSAPPRIAVRSGQKIGKSALDGWVAPWFYETQPCGRVFMCAAIQEQTKLVLWKALGDVLRHARSCGEEIDGKLAASPAGGFVSSDGSREIRGISGREIESIAGLSGRQLTIIDEASHLGADTTLHPCSGLNWADSSA